MALTANSRGSGSTNTGGESTLAITPASNSGIWPGSMMYLAVACDNSGASGTSPLNTVTDSLGNTWDFDTNSVNSAGNVANDGVVMIVYSCLPRNALTTADTITVDFGGITTVARAWTLTEITCAANKYIARVAGAGGTAMGNSTTPSVTAAGAHAVGDCVLGFMTAQGNAAITADSDTVGGNWSTQQTSGVGVGAAGTEIASQNKVVTATTAQTYDTVITSALWIARMRVVREIALASLAFSRNRGAHRTLITR